MSLTGQLKTVDSPLNRLLAEFNIRERVTDFVEQHNDKLSHITPIASPYWQQSDYALTGMATTYMIALLKGSANTLIHRVYPDVPAFAETLTLPQAAILFALCDRLYRSGNRARLLTSGSYLLDAGWLYDKSNAIRVNEIKASIHDVECLQGNAATLLDIKDQYNVWEFQATFAGSELVGGADANLLLDRSIVVDIRSTRKRHPMQVDNLIQQIMYAVLAYPDTQITALGFFYVRHGVYIEYPVHNLNVPQLAAGYKAIAEQTA